jgi:hypothetical protein
MTCKEAKCDEKCFRRKWTWQSTDLRVYNRLIFKSFLETEFAF